MRMTVSLCVIMVEITNNLKLLPLIMLVLLISKVSFDAGQLTILSGCLFIDIGLRVTHVQAVGDAFNEGLYEEQARLRAIPLLESKPKYQMRYVTAKEACGNQKVRVSSVPLSWSGPTSRCLFPCLCGRSSFCGIEPKTVVGFFTLFQLKLLSQHSCLIWMAEILLPFLLFYFC